MRTATTQQRCPAAAAQQQHSTQRSARCSVPAGRGLEVRVQPGANHQGICWCSDRLAEAQVGPLRAVVRRQRVLLALTLPRRLLQLLLLLGRRPALQAVQAVLV